MFLSETGFYTPPPPEGKIATDTLTPLPAPVVYRISGPMGGGFLYTTGAEAENSAVNSSKKSVPSLYKNRSPNFLFCFGGGEREEEPEAKRGGGVLFIWNREGGKVSEEGRRDGAHWGWEGVAGRKGGG